MKKGRKEEACLSYSVAALRNHLNFWKKRFIIFRFLYIPNLQVYRPVAWKHCVVEELYNFIPCSAISPCISFVPYVQSASTLFSIISACSNHPIAWGTIILITRGVSKGTLKEIGREKGRSRVRAKSTEAGLHFSKTVVCPNKHFENSNFLGKHLFLRARVGM